MRTNFYCLLLLMVMFLSCSDDPTKVKRKELIEKDKLVHILAEIHLTDAITNKPEYFGMYDTRDSIDLYSSIFRKYGTNKAEFDSTIANYSKKPDLFLEIYDEVILELTYRLDSLKKNEPRFETPENN